MIAFVQVCWHTADARCDAPEPLLIACSLPRLPKRAKPRYHLRLSPINSPLTLIDVGARRSEHAHDLAKETVRMRTVLVVTPVPLCSSPFTRSPRVSYVAFSPSH